MQICVPSALKTAINTLSSPGRLIKFSSFDTIANLLIAFEIFLAIYGLILSWKMQKGIPDLIEDKQHSLVFPVYVSWIVVLIKLTCAFCVVLFRFVKQILDEDIKDRNKTKLALCTEGLCRAQKLRIMRTNFSADILVIVFLIFFMAIPLFFDTGFPKLDTQDQLITIQSYLRSRNQTSCLEFYHQLLPYSYVMQIFTCVAFGLIVKHSLICSELDYTLQSRLFESSFVPNTDSYISWLHHSRELRTVIATGLLLVAVFYFAIYTGFLSPLMWVPFTLSDDAVQMFESEIPPCNKALLSCAILLLLVDGGVMSLPWTAKSIIANQARMKHRLLGKRPWTYLTVPRKKVVLSLTFF